jgi:trans-aconitate 2-methyltransferase
MAVTDWDPAAYAAFRGLRLRPALDLLARLGDLPPGDVVDLGCGDGAAAGPIRARFPGRRIIGVDSSAAMLDKACSHDVRQQTDIADWQPDAPPALIFSNAALHWLGDHAGLLPRLARTLAPAGTLAVQMPRQFLAPSHALIRQLAQAMFPDRFDVGSWEAPVHPPGDYHAILSPLGAVQIWETEYLQELAPSPGAHPVRRFTESTALRPVAARLAPGERAAFLSAYDLALQDAYPALPDGRVLFPFRRLFLVLERP